MKLLAAAAILWIIGWMADNRLENTARELSGGRRVATKELARSIHACMAALVLGRLGAIVCVIWWLVLVLMGQPIFGSAP